MDQPDPDWKQSTRYGEFEHDQLSSLAKIIFIPLIVFVVFLVFANITNIGYAPGGASPYQDLIFATVMTTVVLIIYVSLKEASDRDWTQ